MYFEKYDNSKVEKNILNDINSIIFELKKTRSKSKYDRLLADLSQLYYLAELNNIYDYPDVDNYVFRTINPYNIIKRNETANRKYGNLLNMVNDDFNYHMNFAELYSLFTKYNYQIDYRKYAHLDNFKMIEQYAKEIMYEYDPSLLKVYNIVAKNNHIIVNNSFFDNEMGLFVPLSGNRTSYLSIGLCNNIDDVSTIVHETAHLKQYLLYKNNYTNRDYGYIFREVYSYYLQYIAYYQLKEKTPFKEDVDSCFNDCLDALNSYLIELSDELEHLEDDKKNYEIFNTLQYAYGMIIGLKYFDIYKNDKEYAKYLTNQFIEQSYKMKPLEVLNNFGLDRDDILSGDVLKKYIKKGRL